MEILFAEHPYHNTTQSSAFFIDLLKQIGHVTIYREEPEATAAFKANANQLRDFDAIVIWQYSSLIETRRTQLIKHPNVTLIPMLDHVMLSNQRAWALLFRTFKTVCFSLNLFEKVRRHTAHVRYCQFFPEPARTVKIDDGALKGFLWRRTFNPTDDTLARLCTGNTFDAFTLHLAPDPAESALIQRPTLCPVSTIKYDVTFWHNAHEDYLRAVAKHNVFFAPRRYEGIGMAFLEAMSMGLCVVAPNTPTHNEYIDDGISGLLYGESTNSLDLSGVANLGAGAREILHLGHARWLKCQDELMSFVVNPALIS